MKDNEVYLIRRFIKNDYMKKGKPFQTVLLIGKDELTYDWSLDRSSVKENV